MPLWGRKTIIALARRANSENKYILVKPDKSDKLKKISFGIRKTNPKALVGFYFIKVCIIRF